MSDPTQFADETSLGGVARQLATEHFLTTQPSGPPLLLLRLKQYESALKRIYEEWSEIGDQDPLLPSAADWLLDNYYIVRQVMQQLKKDLPPSYYSELPVLAGIETAQVVQPPTPRVYRLACTLVEQMALQPAMAAIIQFLEVYQREAPLTMGELWAIPSMLRYVLLERLAQAAARLTHHAEILTGLSVTDGGVDKIAGERSQQNRLDDDQIVADAFVGLRVVNNTDWKLFFEAVSLVHHLLMQDPEGSYMEMDNDTRNRYRQQVEHLARYSRQSEIEVATRVLALAQQAAGATIAATSSSTLETGDAARTSHVGYYLLDKGRRQLEEGLEYDPPLSRRLRRLAYDHPTTLYLGSISLLTLVVLTALLIGTTRAGGNAWQVAIVALLGIVPALTFAVSILHWLLTLLLPPRICQS